MSPSYSHNSHTLPPYPLTPPLPPPLRPPTPPPAPPPASQPLAKPSTDSYTARLLRLLPFSPSTPLPPIPIPGHPNIMSNSAIAQVFSLDPRLPNNNSLPKRKPKRPTNALKKLFLMSSSASSLKSAKSSPSAGDRLPKHSNIFTGLPTPTDSGGHTTPAAGYRSSRSRSSSSSSSRSASPRSTSSDLQGTASPARFWGRKHRRPSQSSASSSTQPTVTSPEDQLTPMPSVHEPMPELYPGATLQEIEAYERAKRSEDEVRGYFLGGAGGRRGVHPAAVETARDRGRGRNREDGAERGAFSEETRRRENRRPSTLETAGRVIPDNRTENRGPERDSRSRDSSTTTATTTTTATGKQKYDRTVCSRKAPPAETPPPDQRKRRSGKQPTRAPTAPEQTQSGTSTALNLDTRTLRWTQTLPSPSQSPYSPYSPNNPSLTLKDMNHDSTSITNPSRPLNQNRHPTPNHPSSTNLQQHQRIEAQQQSGSNAHTPSTSPSRSLQHPPQSTCTSHPSPYRDPQTHLHLTPPASPNPNLTSMIRRKLPDSPPYTKGEAAEYYNSSVSSGEADGEVGARSWHEETRGGMGGDGFWLWFVHDAGSEGWWGVVVRVWVVVVGTWVLFVALRLLEKMLGVVDVVIVEPGRWFWGRTRG